MIKCPDCNCTTHSLDDHYMTKLKGQAEKVRRTRVKFKLTVIEKEIWEKEHEN